MPRRQTWLSAKPTELKTFVPQDFYGTHLGTFGGLLQQRNLKNHEFNFFPKLPTNPSS